MKGLSKEERDLLLKDLCAMLPYDLQVNVEGDNEPYVLLSVHPNKDIALIGINMGGVYATSKVKIDTIKPYHRPMSSMTEEEKEELNCLCYHNIGVQDNMLQGYLCGSEINDVIDWLISHHFDYHTDDEGKTMIENGLAIEVTENNNPYK
jgi:hypothetical protein